MRITRRHAYSALAGVGILVGTAGIANAAIGSGSTDTNPSATATQASTPDPTDADGGTEGNEATEANEANETDGGTEGADEAPKYTSSITVPDGTEAANESDEETALADVATITADDAAAAAVASTPGTVGEIELENEDGNVVYSVEIDTASGKVEVKVDAGNAKVLDTQADDGDVHDSGDANEAPGTEEADD
jgi:uncharacterized membrane protein YkoI